MEQLDAYCDHLRARVAEATPRRAVVEQPSVRELDNHVRVRHASALYAGAFAASRALVIAALGDRAGSARVRMVGSEVEYKRIPSGIVTSTAEPTGPGWDALGGDEPLELVTAVRSTNEDGGVTVELSATWRVG